MYKSAFFCYFSPFLFTVDVITLQCTSLIKKVISKMKLIVAFITLCCCLQVLGQDKFPDGKLIPDWFRNNESVNINSLGKQYRITDYGVEIGRAHV